MANDSICEYDKSWGKHNWQFVKEILALPAGTRFFLFACVCGVAKEVQQK